MNQTCVAGHLGADVEVRYTTNGQKVVSFRLGAKARRGGKDDTIWWRITVWGDQIDNMVPYLKKGTALIVNGEMSKPEIFTNRDGQPQISMNMTAFNVMFSPFGRPEKTQEGGQTQAYQPAEQKPAAQPVGAATYTADNKATANTNSGGFSSGMAAESYTNNMPADDEIPF